MTFAFQVNSHSKMEGLRLPLSPACTIMCSVSIHCIDALYVNMYSTHKERGGYVRSTRALTKHVLKPCSLDDYYILKKLADMYPNLI